MQAFEAKGVLEKFIGEQATRQATDEDLSQVSAVHQDLVKAESVGDFEAYTRLNAVFHLKLATLAGNSEIVTFYQRLETKLRSVRYRINLEPTRLRASLSEHQGIVDALFVRARLDVADRLFEHNTATARVVLEQLALDR